MYISGTQRFPGTGLSQGAWGVPHLIHAIPRTYAAEWRASPSRPRHAWGACAPLPRSTEAGLRVARMLRYQADMMTTNGEVMFKHAEALEKER